MATVAECETAVRLLADRLAALDADVRERHLADRSVSCHLVDLGFLLLGRLSTSGLHEIQVVQRVSGAERAQVRVALASDDLLALANGELSLATAWATGRLRLQAPTRDLLKLRAALPAAGR